MEVQEVKMPHKTPHVSCLNLSFQQIKASISIIIFSKTFSAPLFSPNFINNSIAIVELWVSERPDSRINSAKNSLWLLYNVNLPIVQIPIVLHYKT